jgi:hypothetical protein
MQSFLVPLKIKKLLQFQLTHHKTHAKQTKNAAAAAISCNFNAA